MHIIGGIYREKCLHPSWNYIYGSGGRAALAICEMGEDVHLHSYVNDEYKKFLEIESRFCSGNLTIEQYNTNESLEFNYTHGLANITPPFSKNNNPDISVKTESVLMFGMIECKATIDAIYAVYDPQSTFETLSFRETGSKAKHLALVLNEKEIYVLANANHINNIEDTIRIIAEKENAEVVVVKRGPEGALLYHNNKFSRIPLYVTEKVWKIGSGDCFSAHFALNWILLKKTPEESALNASKATSYYCQTQCLPSKANLKFYEPAPLVINNKKKCRVYLAGPIFNLAQLWIVEQARNNLIDMGLEVFSPYHDVGLSNDKNFIYDEDVIGLNNSDMVFAILDGLDSGTIFEIGFASAKGKKIIIYNESVDDKDLVMFSGSETFIINDFVSAIYKTVWESLCLKEQD
ncbi:MULTISPECIES: PfkB family carbohydrate kinase [Klebsiella]|uniref:PfkB family carbohydrate kinase n=1 Tax=Klebsiella TaxID=570 RepID=UPI0008A2F333|nr:MULTISPECIES: PfkB family carbohydrate kinase [Klebsiella]MCG5492573.1 nucleoside 2-deoxyribosyltransferase [Klebsiella variicola]